MFWLVWIEPLSPTSIEKSSPFAMARMELPCGRGLDQRHGPSAALAERGAIDATMPNNSSAMAEREWIVMKCIGRFLLNNSLVIKCFNSIK
jgi:hypothetical protein